MKVRIYLTDEKGASFEGEATLSPIKRAAEKSRVKTHVSKSAASSFSFKLNPRAFMKKYSRGCSGPQKFTLLVARLVKGENDQEVSVDDISKNWNNMTSILGGEFNRAYGVRAKENGWVDSHKRGMYILAESWRDAVSEQ